MLGSVVALSGQVSFQCGCGCPWRCQAWNGLLKQGRERLGEFLIWRSVEGCPMSGERCYVKRVFNVVAFALSREVVRCTPSPGEFLMRYS